MWHDMACMTDPGSSRQPTNRSSRHQTVRSCRLDHIRRPLRGTTDALHRQPIEPHTCTRSDAAHRLLRNVNPESRLKSSEDPRGMYRVRARGPIAMPAAEGAKRERLLSENSPTAACGSLTPQSQSAPFCIWNLGSQSGLRLEH